MQESIKKYSRQELIEIFHNKKLISKSVLQKGLHKKILENINNEEIMTSNFKLPENIEHLLKEVLEIFFKEDELENNIKISAKNILIFEYHLTLSRILSEISLLSEKRGIYYSNEDNKIYFQKKFENCASKKGMVRINLGNVIDYVDEINKEIIDNIWSFSNILYNSSSLSLSTIIYLLEPSIANKFEHITNQDSSETILDLLNEYDINISNVRKRFEYYLEFLAKEKIVIVNNICNDSTDLKDKLSNIRNNLAEGIDKFELLSVFQNKKKLVDKMKIEKNFDPLLRKLLYTLRYLGEYNENDTNQNLIRVLESVEDEQIQNCSRGESEILITNLIKTVSFFHDKLNLIEENRGRLNDLKTITFKHLGKELAKEYVGDKSFDEVEKWWSEGIDFFIEKKYISYVQRFVFKEIFSEKININDVIKTKYQNTICYDLPAGLCQVIFDDVGYSLRILEKLSKETENFLLSYNNKILKIHFYSEEKFAEKNDIGSWLKKLAGKCNEYNIENKECEDIKLDELNSLIREFILTSLINRRKEENLLNDQSIDVKKRKI